MIGDEKVKAETEIISEKEQIKGTKFLTAIKPHRGHTLFEVSVKTGFIRKAQFEQTDQFFNAEQKGKNISRTKVICNEGCIYVSALNEKNAIKKLKKQKQK